MSLVVYNIVGAKRLGTLTVTPDEGWELEGCSQFLAGTPTEGTIPDGYIGVLPLGIKGFYTWVVVKPK